MSQCAHLFTALITKNPRQVAFAAAIIIYAIYGSPTPDTITPIEIIIAGLLCLAIGATTFYHALHIESQSPPWRATCQLLLFIGLTIGIIGAVINNAPPTAIIRDIIALGFLCLPLLLFNLHRDNPRLGIALFCLLGTIFAIRAIIPYLPIALPVTGYDALYYLGNSPALLFTAIFCAGMGIEKITAAFSLQSLIKSSVLFMLSILTLSPIILTLQRASIAAFIVSIIIITALCFFKNPRRTLLFIAIIALPAIITASPILLDAYLALKTKTTQVGANMRLQEWGAVWNTIASHPLSLLFGRGWGASFSSPAVADINVFYTHSLLSAMLLKTGLCGFILCTLYLFSLLIPLLKKAQIYPVLILSIAAPLYIDTFLYAAYKSLDFGLLLVMITVIIRQQNYTKTTAATIASPQPIMHA